MLFIPTPSFSSSFYVFAYLASLLGILYVIFIAWETSYARTNRNLPPGPRSWPLVGCIPTLLYLALIKRMDKNRMVKYFTEIYGDVISITIFNQVTIFLSHDAIKEAFRNPYLSDKSIINTKTCK